MPRAQKREYKAKIDIFCRTYQDAVKTKKKYVLKGFKGRIVKEGSGYRVYLS